MTLTDGGHVSINGIEYMLAEQVEPHYIHRFESLFSPTQAIAGEIAKDQIRPEKLLWSMTDFSGGEGALIYYPQDPTRYEVGSLVNPTTRGKLTTRPRRYRSAVARAGDNADTQQRPYGGSAYTHALIAWEDNIVQSPNAIGWSTVQDSSPDGSGHSYSDAVTDGTNMAFLYSNNTDPEIPVVQADISVNAWADMHTSVVDALSPAVGCVLDGVPYVFAQDNGTGALMLHKKATVMDDDADWSVEIFLTEITPSGAWGHDFWTDCEAAETSLFFSYSTHSITYVWECRADIGRPFWTSPPGFAGKRLIYSSGVLFIVGNQTSSSGRKYGGVWAIPLTTRSPIKIAKPRFVQNTELTDCSVGCPGEEGIFFADASAGKVFYYDIERDAISLFDDLVNGGTGDGMDFVDSSNLLESVQVDHEVGTGQARTWPTATTGVNGWYAEANCAITSDNALAFSGLRSLRVRSTAGGNMSAITTNGLGGIRVQPSTVYTAGFQLRSAVSARTARAVIRWYTAAGVFISDSDGAGAADSAAAWTAYTASGTSPATAAFAALAVEVDSTGAGSEDHHVDAAFFHLGSSTVYGDRIAFLAMHGVKLFGATYTPFETGATSLQVFSYDDLLPQNRDNSQAISATWESSQWDNGVPMEIKGLIGFYVTFEVTDSTTTSGLIANSRITVSYAIDDGTYTALTAITSATTPSGAKGRVFQQVSSGSATTKYSRLKVKVTLDNNATAGVAPPVLLGVTAESQLLAYAETWDLALRVEDEAQNFRPLSRANVASYLRDNLEDLAQNKNVVTFLDGYRYKWPHSDTVAGYTSHVVVVEDPSDEITTLSEGVMRVKLRAIV